MKRKRTTLMLIGAGLLLVAVAAAVPFIQTDVVVNPASSGATQFDIGVTGNAHNGAPTQKRGAAVPAGESAHFFVPVALYR